MNDDLISRQAAIEAIEKLYLPLKKGETAEEEINRVAWRCALNCAEQIVGNLPTIDAVPNEKFTDKEKRIFLAAMGRELDICKEVDQEFPAREAYEDTLESVCREITRKVKGALWT